MDLVSGVGLSAVSDVANLRDAFEKVRQKRCGDDRFADRRSSVLCVLQAQRVSSIDR
jgi:hypothetical protein